MGVRLKKVQAFTLNEMIVVLLITVIVVGMAFSVLDLVQKQMKNIEGIYDVKLEANNLRQSLWIDFNKYSSVFYDEEDERLHFSNELGTKQYEITEQGIITEKDTFDIQLQSKKFYFNNEISTTGQIDAIELETTKETGGQRIFIYKQNAAVTYMNQ